MRNIMTIMLMLICVSTLFANEIIGDWHGMLDLSGMKLRLVFHIEADGDGLKATFDSPDQGAFGLPVSKVSYEAPWLELETTSPIIKYSGELKNGVIEGTFNQAGFEAKLDMKREVMEKPVFVRPQEPQKPYPYKVKDLKFKNKQAGIKLAGTLTLPKTKGKHPAVILISGSGPQDRNEELLGHKPFWVIADYLTRQGIAVLRFDDRGVGKSQGDFASATTQDFATDVASAVKYLKSRKDIGKIGLVGHSEGGVIAPMVATQMPEVNFIVLLAGTGVRGDQLLLLQQEAIWKAEDTDEEDIEKSMYVNRNIFAMIMAEQDVTLLQEQIRNFLNKSITDGMINIPEGYTPEDVVTQAVAETTNPWMLYFIRHDPALVLQKVKIPVLALIGTNDLQVPPKENLSGIQAALELAGNKDFKLVELEGLNHLFQTCETGHPSEYARIEETFSPQALEIMSDWIKQKGAMK